MQVRCIRRQGDGPSSHSNVVSTCWSAISVEVLGILKCREDLLKKEWVELAVGGVKNGIHDTRVLKQLSIESRVIETERESLTISRICSCFLTKECKKLLVPQLDWPHVQ